MCKYYRLLTLIETLQEHFGDEWEWELHALHMCTCIIYIYSGILYASRRHGTNS